MGGALLQSGLKIFSISLVCLLAIGACLWRFLLENSLGSGRSFDESPLAYVILIRGGQPLEVDVRVQDLDGRPLSGVSVNVRNNSGGNPATCDSLGRALIQVSETDIEQIIVDGVNVLNRRRNWLTSFPTVEHGLRVLIIRKLTNNLPTDW